ncbi:MAG: RIP metalloprotease [Alphaproteobacteria bacterium]|nr:RIP metalloprotease [Alphaproteobacteria bacterium]
MEYLDKFLAAPMSGLTDYVLPFVLVLGVLVFVHEWGHYIVARLCGVKVEKFSIGFGREIWGRTDKSGTRWKIGWMPLGGYVQMFGDVDPASVKTAEGVEEEDGIRPFSDEEKKVAFYSQSVGRRSAIVFAGPAINFLFAIVILTGLFWVKGEPYTPAVIGAVVENSAASSVDIQPDDKFIALNGKKIDRFEDLGPIIAVNLDEMLEITLLRSVSPGVWSDTPITVKVRPKVIEETDRFGFRHTIGRLGVTSPKDAFELREHGFASAFVASLDETWRITASTLKSIGQMILGTRSKEELGGILRIGAYAGQFAKEGLVSLITFSALLSVNLGLINLFPIPLLDGGHLAFYAMETVKGKPVDERAQEYALRAGLVFLVCLMVFATWNDLVQMKVVDYVIALIS